MTKVTQAHIDARRQDILDAARRMFIRKGVDAATVQDIATEAGLSAGAIYRYYPSKAELLRAVCGDWVEKDRALFEQAAVESDSPVEALLRVGRLVWEDMKRPDCREDMMLSLETVLVGARQSPELAAERKAGILEAERLLERLIRLAQEAGEIETQLDARALAYTLLACSFGTRMLALDLGEDMNTDAVLDMVGVVLGRFAPRPGQP